MQLESTSYLRSHLTFLLALSWGCSCFHPFACTIVCLFPHGTRSGSWTGRLQFTGFANHLLAYRRVRAAQCRSRAGPAAHHGTARGAASPSQHQWCVERPVCTGKWHLQNNVPGLIFTGLLGCESSRDTIYVSVFSLRKTLTWNT